ncbi:uncharacterized protein LOC123013604 isoform X2 [Tribolium madens]|uniref:uncharacterized protein LOC123013604 isoform X2 n=1 Tax=Tribolium madens TaxID=41895 RepID=UPI001CF72C99|nr:uncharacterized protein LOC123013604 isoform X2 [Tribolium madens]
MYKSENSENFEDIVYRHHQHSTVVNDGYSPNRNSFNSTTINQNDYENKLNRNKSRSVYIPRTNYENTPSNTSLHRNRSLKDLQIYSNIWQNPIINRENSVHNLRSLFENSITHAPREKKHVQEARMRIPLINKNQVQKNRSFFENLSSTNDSYLENKHKKYDVLQSKVLSQNTKEKKENDNSNSFSYTNRNTLPRTLHLGDYDCKETQKQAQLIDGSKTTNVNHKAPKKVNNIYRTLSTSPSGLPNKGGQSFDNNNLPINKSTYYLEIKNKDKKVENKGFQNKAKNDNEQEITKPQPSFLANRYFDKSQNKNKENDNRKKKSSGEKNENTVNKFDNSSGTTDFQKIRINKRFFKKKPETNDLGRTFEDLTAADLILNFVCDEKIKNFHLSSNDTDFGIFDDVVFTTESSEFPIRTYLMQLKYSNKHNVLSKNSLTGKKSQGKENSGNFSLPKYCKEYQKLKNKLENFTAVLCTNRKFNCKDNEKITVYDESGEIIVRIKRCKIDLSALLFKRNNNEECNCYKFEVETPSNSDNIRKYIEFFQNFFLITDQMDVSKLRNNLWQTFQQNISNDNEAFQKYLNFISQWSENAGLKNKLNKTLIQQVIAEHLLTPYIHFYSFNKTGEISKRLNLLKQAICLFKVTVINKDYCHEINSMWQDAKSELLSSKNLKTNLNCYQICSKIDLNDLSNEELTKLLWHLGKIPLMIDNQKNALDAIKLCEHANVSFILFNPISYRGFDTFENVNILKYKSHEIYSNILRHLSCKLQNRTILLETLVSNYENVAKCLSPSDLMSMIKQTFEIGEPAEVLPPSYITRFLQKIIIHPDFLNNCDENTRILISCYKENNDVIKDTISKFKLFNINKEELSKKSAKNKTIFISEMECSHDQFEKICNLDKKYECHQLRLDPNDGLEWVKSSKSINDISKFQLPGQYFISEKDLFVYEQDNNINIICDEPGIGKTSLMKSAKNYSGSPEYWTIFITARNLFTYFLKNKDNIREFKEYIVQQTSSNIHSNILESFMKKKRVRLIWDGLDEVSDKNLEYIIHIISELSQQNFQQWITARTNLKYKLETEFNVCSRTIKTFNEKDQEDYIQSRVKYTSESLRQSLLQNRKNIQLLWNNEFLGIPLQMFILTELLLQDSKKYSFLFEETFTVTVLFEHFVNTKLDFVFKDKELYPKNDVEHQIFLESKATQIDIYEKIAAKMYVDIETNEFHVSNFLTKLTSKKDEFGIILRITPDNKPEFFHSSFQEYFTASYLVKNLHRINEFRDVIFNNRGVRYFFDLILAKNSTPHIAVLYKNKNLLERYIRTDRQALSQAKDEGGRNLLHLACSWGQTFLPLRVKNSDVFEIDDKIMFWHNLKDNSSENINILKSVQNICDPLEKDKLFNLDAFGYSCEAHCFLSFALLQNKSKIDLEKYKKEIGNFESYVFSILYYAIRLDCANVFDNFEEIPLVKSMHFNASLLYLAVWYNSVNCLEKMLSNSNDNPYIEIIKKSTEPLLIAAIDKSYTKCLNILLAHGANLKSEKDNSPEKLKWQSKTTKRNMTIH